MKGVRVRKVAFEGKRKIKKPSSFLITIFEIRNEKIKNAKTPKKRAEKPPEAK